MYVSVRMPYIMYELTVLLVVSVLSISFRWPDGLGRSYPTILRKLLKLKSFLDIYVCMYTSYSFEIKKEDSNITRAADRSLMHWRKQGSNVGKKGFKKAV